MVGKAIYAFLLLFFGIWLIYIIVNMATIPAETMSLLTQATIWGITAFIGIGWVLALFGFLSTFGKK